MHTVRADDFHMLFDAAHIVHSWCLACYWTGPTHLAGFGSIAPTFAKAPAGRIGKDLGKDFEIRSETRPVWSRKRTSFLAGDTSAMCH